MSWTRSSTSWERGVSRSASQCSVAANTALGAITGRNPQTGAQVQPGYDGLDASLAQASATARVAADVSPTFQPMRRSPARRRRRRVSCWIR